MTRKILYNVLSLLIILIVSCSTPPDKTTIDQRAKLALREVGNTLLVENQDSTSLVLPVKVLEPFKYELSFENVLAFDPALINSAVRTSFEKASLPINYRVEVIQCSNGEVGYSYEIFRKSENNIVPCRGRLFPEGCYKVQVYFTKIDNVFAIKDVLFYALVSAILGFLVLVFYSRYVSYHREDDLEDTSLLGTFRFYPEQNKLVKEAKDIPLSRKECELLEILVANLNLVVKREELTKKVWEDNGVIVSRSLDTYISKLRKKLQEDESIKITNVHGVGYKLEIV
ncbi:winged helix-turn-helix domain-containing protein [Patiriisocius sp. Uisw_017]|jgi:hypothetical protein|uniref:winged helix-turn-helix domain-containing protein n=1 Tax=Patiriisocius sp. Uisw_017 TaxID=3230968 RepID=UPI0039EA06F4